MADVRQLPGEGVGALLCATRLSLASGVWADIIDLPFVSE
jgi:hypothetical protein